MIAHSVRYQKQLEKRGEAETPVSIQEGADRVKAMAGVKASRTYKGARKRKEVDQTIDLVVHLGVDTKQADQNLRGAVSLPRGIGKAKKVIAFCGSDMVSAAKAAGAVEAGLDDLIDKVSKGWMDFDVAVAQPSVMNKVSKLGRTLGPTGKMPSPKSGTVSEDIETTVREFSAGKVEYRTDAGGNIHVVVGKASFSTEDLTANIESFVAHIHKIKPASAKGHYIKRVCLSGSMTPSVTLAVT